MKRSDFLAIGFLLLLLTIFINQQSRAGYNALYNHYPILLSFLKFSILATFGEMLILRLFKGRYTTKEFGLIPKAIVWGILGVSLYLAFTIFYGGVTWLLFEGSIPESYSLKLLHAFSISFFMNIFYAPILMLTHHISDRFIQLNDGGFPIKNFQALVLLKQIDWDRMWGFVIKKTIPLFWIPIHTITFLLPEQYRVLIAAILSIVLGLFLATTSKTNRKD